MQVGTLFDRHGTVGRKPSDILHVAPGVGPDDYTLGDSVRQHSHCFADACLDKVDVVEAVLGRQGLRTRVYSTTSPCGCAATALVMSGMRALPIRRMRVHRRLLVHDLQK